MCKWLVKSLLILDLILSSVSGVASDAVLSSQSPKTYSEDSQIIEVPITYETGNVIVRGGATQENASKVYSYYLKIPENVRMYFESEGWSLILTDENFGTQYGYDYSIMALTVFSNAEKTVYIDNRPEALSAVIHEVGHIIDWGSSSCSDSDDFQIIFKAESCIFASSFQTHPNNYASPAEYFAEAFQFCIEFPADMQRYCPQTYDFIMAKVNEL